MKSFYDAIIVLLSPYDRAMSNKVAGNIGLQASPHFRVALKKKGVGRVVGLFLVEVAEGVESLFQLTGFFLR